MKITKQRLKEIVAEEFMKEGDSEWVDINQLEPRSGKSPERADDQEAYEMHMKSSRNTIMDLYGNSGPQVWELITTALYAHPGSFEGVMPLHQEIADLGEPEPPTLGSYMDKGDE